MQASSWKRTSSITFTTVLYVRIMNPFRDYMLDFAGRNRFKLSVYEQVVIDLELKCDLA